jgi:hypothetical protein
MSTTHFLFGGTFDHFHPLAQKKWGYFGLK